MAKVTNYKSRIASMAGALIEADDDALEQYMLDSAYEIISVLKLQASMRLGWFLKQSSSFNDNNGQDVSSINDIISVERSDVECTEGNLQSKKAYEDVGSMYEASANDPKYLVSENKLFVYPSPTSTEGASYLYIPEYEVKNFSSGVSSLESSDGAKFPRNYEEALIICSSVKVLNRRLNDYLEKDEDVELVNGLQLQIQRLDQEYQKILGLTK